MLHNLKPINTHPCYDMQNILLAVVEAAVNGRIFEKSIFPILMQNNWNDNWKDSDNIINRLYCDLYQHIEKLTLQQKNDFLEQFKNNNDIKNLCNNKNINILDNINWNTVPGKKLKDFFLKCYGNLDLAMFKRPEIRCKPRKDYDELFRDNNLYVCPFCGLNEYPNKFADNRADFDHYIYKGKYPFAAGNMANLIPMCVECNRDNKKAKNVLFTGNKRTYAFYPYDEIPKLIFRIECVTEPVKDTTYGGDWTIHIDPETYDPVVIEKIITWDRVFKIKKRYVDEVREKHFSWMKSLLKTHHSKFNDLNEFRVFMREKSYEFSLNIKERMTPKLYVQTIFFEYMANEASDKFISRYVNLHNVRA